MNVYLIKDTRRERAEEKPSYVSGGSETTHDLYSAKRYTNKREAGSAARAWEKLMDYCPGSHWVTVEKLFFRKGQFKIV